MIQTQGSFTNGSDRIGAASTPRERDRAYSQEAHHPPRPRSLTTTPVVPPQQRAWTDMYMASAGDMCARSSGPHSIPVRSADVWSCDPRRGGGALRKRPMWRVGPTRLLLHR
eukprot:7385124-Prymnesium_polylepis.2